MPFPREYISHNQIRLYCDCPQKYYFTYIAEVRVPINEKIYLGTVFHAAVEAYLTRKIAEPNTSPLTMREIYQVLFSQLQSEKEIKWHGAKEKTRERGAAFINYFIQAIAPSLRPLMTEKELLVTIPESGIQLKGVIDLVEEDFALTDFKTASAKWPAKRAEQSLQMGIYKYLFEQSFAASCGALKYLVIYSKNAAHVKHQSIPVNITASMSNTLMQTIQHVYHSIANSVFFKNESYMCSYCDFKNTCLNS